MKYARIVKTYTTLCGKTLPIGSIYGRIPCVFTHKEGYKDKSGRVHKRASTKIQDVTYYIPRPETCYQNGAVWFYFWDSIHEKWVESNSKYIKAYNAIYEAVIPLLRDMEYITYRHDDIHKIVAPCQEKKAQATSDGVFRASGSYVLSKRIMTDDINARRRVYVKHTNFAR